MEWPDVGGKNRRIAAGRCAADRMADDRRQMTEDNCASHGSSLSTTMTGWTTRPTLTLNASTATRLPKTPMTTVATTVAKPKSPRPLCPFPIPSGKKILIAVVDGRRGAHGDRADPNITRVRDSANVPFTAETACPPHRPAPTIRGEMRGRLSPGKWALQDAEIALENTLTPGAASTPLADCLSELIRSLYL